MMKINVYPKEEYILTMIIEGEGSTEPEEGIHTYSDVEEVTLQALSAESWEFVEWTGDVHEDEEEREVKIALDSNKTITASFEESAEDGDGGNLPGFTSTLLLMAGIMAVVIY